MSSGAHPSTSVRTSAISLAVALTIHSAAAIAVLGVDPNWNRTFDAPVEIDVNEASPPPPEPPPVPDPPPEPVPPKIVPRRLLATREPPPPQPPSLTPPPPNQEPPPNAAPNTPPVFGVTMSSVVSGEAAMAVPVGNTTMTKPRARPTATPAAPYSGEGTRPFVPVPEVYVATLPRVLEEVNSEDVYPPEAKALGIEGSVKLTIGIDQDGKVVEVRVLPPRAGHRFDEAAAAAMKRTRFSPARTSDGKAVPFRLTYQFTFSMKN